MSLKRQIKRNIARKEDEYLGQFKGLDPTWKTFSREEKSFIANLSRNGITAQDLENARIEGRNQAFRDTGPAILQLAYAAFGIVMHDEAGWDTEEIKRVLGIIDEKIILTIDPEDIAKELEEKCGLRIRSSEGVGRIEQTD